MSEQPMRLRLEIPSDVAQQEVWSFEEQLQQLAGVATELQEPKDLLTETLLLVTIAGPYVAQTITVVGGINTLHDLAAALYGFLHAKKPVAESPGKNKVVIIAKGKRIELYNLSSEEIEMLIKTLK